MLLSIISKEEYERVDILKEWEKEWKHSTEEVESNTKVEMEKNEKLKWRAAHFLIRR